ncbi:LOV domain-containing [Micractinium conductrix]|uniref:LOV domain-containing n=1 Tax=Micractinium conductrix TaxID=554055 RepID=A0A2P6V4D0_9CHLO|nr:LOV domain-containing [Micractinium conductrix]|eukprot:PSC68938.1 LOV domain-containing [Micractinium conductrix]
MPGLPPRPDGPAAAGPHLVASSSAAPPVPRAAAAAAEQAALAEVSTAFGELLSDLQFSFVVASARAPDMPLVYASSNFFSCTGYSVGEVLGRNCRFLQGPGTSHQAVMELRDAVREERACSVCLLNYRKDGTPFWNHLRLQPVCAPNDGPVDYFVGVQADVTRLVEAGGGAPLEAAGAGSAEAAAAVAARLAAHEPDLVAADCTRKCAVLASVPSSLVNALGRVQDCFVLADPNLPDCPIVFASEGFLKLSGYPCHEVVGRNCRFLQGPGTCPQTVAQLRAAPAAEPPRAVTVTLLNYRKADAGGHQQPFWNSLHISPLRDAGGRVQYFAGVQMAICGDDGGEAAVDEAAAAAAATGAAAPPAADPLALLRQKGVVGSLRVATRALAQHGLRRAAQFQRAPSRVE